MQAAAFTNQLSSLTENDFSTIAALIRVKLDTTEGELSWWRATIAVNKSLRRHHLSHRASLLAHEASRAVMAAAERLDILESHHDDVTQVARAASDAVRAIVAGQPADFAGNVVSPLFKPWSLPPSIAS